MAKPPVPRILSPYETIQAATGPRFSSQTRGKAMLGTVLVVLLILLLLGAIPTWPHSKNWGYYPSGGVGLVLLILVILLLTGRL